MQALNQHLMLLYLTVTFDKPIIFDNISASLCPLDAINFQLIFTINIVSYIKYRPTFVFWQ